jgi:L-iditol 2-dehydrogenase
VRAALLHGPGDLRVEEVPDPEGEVVVRVEAATTCGTDVKMFRRGHPVLQGYPAPFGHETAGVREDTGERVLVSDSVPCGRCAPCQAGRPQICREPGWVLGGFAELIAAPESALHPIPEGLDAAGAAMAEPLAAVVHAVARGTDAEDTGVLGAGPMGLMLVRLLALDGRSVTVADHHAERREQAESLGARASETLERHDLVFEAVGRPEAWRAALETTSPGGTLVLVGGCPAGTDAAFPTGPLHYDELDVRGAFHHSREEVDRALDLLGSGQVDWTAFAGGTIGLEELPSALGSPNRGRARKWIVRPAGAGPAQPPAS